MVGPTLWIHYIDATSPGPNHDAFIWRRTPMRALLMHRWFNGVRDELLLGNIPS